ncbi:hypothetical protein C5F59_027415 [Streptomyces sp. QL37]|uniref:hypothetical protein n=1 Tax=Streptomyces sp. QL37 TaxID=2093747 RepID=UPI000CF2D6F8|nr:hypothetical protein [Streptomyces sp. QL37]PPQ57155.1 hypothetical protein C5F59_11015 [Streptomyces sp. QL37]
MKIFGREPALWLNSLAAILGLVVTFNVGLTEDQAGWLVAGTSAVLGAIAAALTRPIAVQAFTAAVATIASGVGAFGFEVAPTTTAAINGCVLAVLMFITRGQVSPITPPAPAARPTSV